ncbi:MAG: hypothetical protein PF447_01045 [Spirochaetaceae bacterium]|jgi:uncharacterized membrane protein YeaQ/YmgE (transglycosylase-associated protein family)|nr:hypothetical protein [Spirochaetaceae bacterium]
MQSLNTFLFLFLIAILSSLFHVVILKKRLVGKLWAAMLVALLGAFVGYYISSLFPLVLPYRMGILSLFFAFLLTQVFLFLLNYFSSLNDY